MLRPRSQLPTRLHAPRHLSLSLPSRPHHGSHSLRSSSHERKHHRIFEHAKGVFVDCRASFQSTEHLLRASLSSTREPREGALMSWLGCRRFGICRKRKTRLKSGWKTSTTSSTNSTASVLVLLPTYLVLMCRSTPRTESRRESSRWERRS